MWLVDNNEGVQRTRNYHVARALRLWVLASPCPLWSYPVGEREPGEGSRRALPAVRDRRQSELTAFRGAARRHRANTTALSGPARVAKGLDKEHVNSFVSKNK